MAPEFQLFPNPSLPPSPISPNGFPGINPESTQALKEVLEENHTKHHIFFNDRGFHNHIAHRALAIWALGADKNIIQASYEYDCKIQRPAFTSPEPITRHNFNDHLGDENYYDAYLKFFTNELKEKPFKTVLEEHIFSSNANFGSQSQSGERPEMLSRFVDGLVHPLIHTGYGLEFGLPGIVAEGLAQTAVHRASSTSIIQRSIFTSDPVPSVSSLRSHIASFTFGTSEKPSPHAFTVLARVLKDEDIRPGKSLNDSMYRAALEESGGAIFRRVSEWADFDPTDQEMIKRKVEEVQWANTLIYALTGLEGESFKADFFTMHLVTSSLFLPSIVAFLSPPSQQAFLRSYFATSIGWYVARGKQPLDVEAFFKLDSASPVLETTPDKAPKSALILSSTNSNPWLAIINECINHPDDHIPKIQRALGHYSVLYGSRGAGDKEFVGTELEGAGKIDGTLFVRAAGLTARRVAERGTEHPWD